MTGPEKLEKRKRIHATYYLLGEAAILASGFDTACSLRILRSGFHALILSSDSAFVTKFMETIITSEQDLSSHDEPLPDGVLLVHFKIVGVGPNTLTEANHLGPKICDIVRPQPGFFVIGSTEEGIRAAMHDLVDRFCDSREEVE